jgi:hypothetical protein
MRLGIEPFKSPSLDIRNLGLEFTVATYLNTEILTVFICKVVIMITTPVYLFLKVSGRA